MNIAGRKMISKYIFNMLSVLLTANLLFATSGVFLYKHYCNIDKKQEVFLLGVEDNCSDQHNKDHSCCSAENFASVAEKDCCDLDTDYLILTEPAVKGEKTFSPGAVPVFAKTNRPYIERHIPILRPQIKVLSAPPSYDIVISFGAFLS